MNSGKSSLVRSLAVLLAASVAAAQTVPDASTRIPLTQPKERKRNRLSASYRMGFNMSASFKNIGGFTGASSLANGRKTPSGDAYNYDNGYVYPDATTASAHPGYTWYYGYIPGTPVNGSDFQLYRATAKGGLNSSDNSSDPQPGFEITYNRELGRLGQGGWGLELAGGFTSLSISDSRGFKTSAYRTTDTYRAGGGAQLSPAPQANPVEGPAGGSPGWPLVGLSPVSSSVTTYANAATVTGNRELDAQIFSARLGPYLDVPLSEKLAVSLSAGLLFLEVNSDFKYDETVTISQTVTLANLAGERHRGSASASNLLVGGYVSGKVSYALSERVGVFAGGQFQTTGDYSQTVGGKTAVLSLSKSIFVSLGMSYSF